MVFLFKYFFNQKFNKNPYKIWVKKCFSEIPIHVNIFLGVFKTTFFHR
ncbi:hypothetical protein GS8_3349 [Geobacillus stearothermophilus]|uniref:Uncharacterized protein n=1 Tax=Geobacillus stearothermophilus TaxID=1422 RepID=A0ABQ7HAT2_GEOSE|nr:hypothetical protein GS8_3349 [Geobacillus stearothermophilus]